MTREFDTRVAEVLGYQRMLTPAVGWGQRPRLDGSQDILSELPEYSSNATGMMLLLNEMKALRYRWTICLEDENTISVDIQRNPCDDCRRNDGESYKLAKSIYELPLTVAEAFVDAAK